jgi:hypothetical protein
MRTLKNFEMSVVSGGFNEDQLLADLQFAMGEADKKPDALDRAGRIALILEGLGYLSDAIDWAMSKIPRLDDLGNGGYPGYGRGSPGDGTVPGDPYAGASSGGGPLQAYYWEKKERD